MISVSVLFWKYTAFFAFLGAARGWAKELLVTSAVIIAMLLTSALETIFPAIQDSLTARSRFWVQLFILVIMIFLAYQATRFSQLSRSKKFTRNNFEGTFFGFLLGALNGYMIIGAAWYYMIEANFPFAWVTAPDPAAEVGQKMLALMRFLPPQWLQGPFTYIAGVLAILFIVVVLI